MTTAPATASILHAEPADPAVTRILDAALELFEDVGIRKSTIEDIARRAGVDRVTVYRRVGSKNEVERAVVAREAQRIMTRVAMRAVGKSTLEDRVVTAFTDFVLLMRDHVLFQRLVKLDPDETLPKVTTEAGGMLATGIYGAVELLLPPKANAKARADLTARVEIVARFIHSSMLTPQGVVELSSARQLGAFARRYIVPIVAGTPAAP